MNYAKALRCRARDAFEALRIAESDVADSQHNVMRLSGEAKQAELERAQQAWATAKAIFDGPGSWCSIELPHRKGTQAKMTLLGEGRWAAVRGAHADCERIKGELAGLDALEQAELREAA